MHSDKPGKAKDEGGHSRYTDNITQCIATTVLSNHSRISMSLALERKIRKTLWKLKSNILNDSKLLERLKGDISDYLDLNDSGEVSPEILWDTLKAVMRGEIISITKYMKKRKGQKFYRGN